MVKANRALIKVTPRFTGTTSHRKISGYVVNVYDDDCCLLLQSKIYHKHSKHFANKLAERLHDAFPKFRLETY